MFVKFFFFVNPARRGGEVDVVIPRPSTWLHTSYIFGERHLASDIINYSWGLVQMTTEKPIIGYIHFYK